MKEETTMKVICEYPAGTLRNATSANNIPALANAVRVMPGIGRPFLVFNSLPGQVVIADFEYPPLMIDDGNGGTRFKYIVSSNATENKDMINEMLENPPIDALTFA